MSIVDVTYHQLAMSILDNGYWYMDKSREQRCKQLSTTTLNFDMFSDFPVMTTKRMYLKGIVAELIWFLRGESNIISLLEQNVHIWDKDAFNYYQKSFPASETTFEEFPQEVLDYKGNYNNVGDVGRNYGVQWRQWRGTADFHEDLDYERIDQIANLIQGLKNNPMSRRHIVTAWNPAELHQTALPPCHWSFEVIPRPTYDFEKEFFPDLEYVFTLKWHQRSVDTFLGLPFNITSYALLSKIIEELTGYKCELLTGDLSNVHFYEGHIEDVRGQLQNDPFKYNSPTFKFSDEAGYDFKLYRDGLNTLDDVFNNLTPDDFIFENYESYPPIKADMYEPLN